MTPECWVMVRPVVGRSATATARNVGARAEPVEGPARKVLAVWAIRLAGVNVPLVVTGVSALAVKITPSPVQDTEVTVPEPVGTAQLASSRRKCVVAAEPPGSG